MTYDTGQAYNDGYNAGYKNGFAAAMDQITDPMNDDLRKVDQIICREWGITYDKLHKRTRLRHIVEPRQLAIYVRRKIFNLMFSQCGNDFGLDHATAIYSVRQAETLIINDKLFKARAQRVLKFAGEIKNFQHKL